MSFSLGIEETRTVRLEVRNALGQTAEKEFTFSRPRPDHSGALSATARLDVTQRPDGGLQALPAGHPEVAPEQMEQLRRALEQTGRDR